MKIVTFPPKYIKETRIDIEWAKKHIKGFEGISDTAARVKQSQNEYKKVRA